MRKSVFLAVFVIGAAVAACSSSSSSPVQSYTFLNAQGFCSQYINQCKGTGTFADCQSNSEPLRVSQACADGTNNATCDDLTNPQAKLYTACFPVCSNPGSSTCEGDQGALDTCDMNGHLKVFDCQKDCTAAGFKSYTGTCGTTYNGMTVTVPKCWCQ